MADPMFGWNGITQTFSYSYNLANFGAFVGSIPYRFHINYYNITTIYGYVRVNLIRQNEAKADANSPNHSLATCTDKVYPLTFGHTSAVSTRYANIDSLGNIMVAGRAVKEPFGPNSGT
jgi:hypothetical protein